ncbi:ABC transporter G family member 39 [Linum perenne]
MAAALTGGVLVGSTSSRRSFGSTSQRSWLSTAADVFSGGGAREKEDEEDELRWAAIERLPTFDRMRKGVLNSVIDGGSVVDVTKLGAQERKKLMESILNVVEDDNENFLRRLRDRTDRVGIKIPKIEVRYEHLSIEGEVHVGSRALPSLLNAAINTIENVLGLIRLAPSRKRKIQILQDISGIVKPARMTLLLGPPGAGKTTMLLALAGKLDSDLKESGKVTYCGHEFSEFIPQRTCAYISQHDLHHGEFTVRETFNFSGQCLGVGTRYEILTELSRREKAAGILPDPEIDAFMKATAVSGQKTSLVTDYILKILGLDICADIIVGDEMQRGISGGQKKRVTTGEMLVGPAKVLLMDEISTGLDSSTTFQICKFMRQMVHILEVTMIISLLQPAPETFELFDDIILLAGGRIVYQGPRENVLEFFESAGFKCPERKGVADFLQEVTSKKDQEQYWHNRNQQPYRFVSATDFAQRFESSHIGQQIGADLRTKMKVGTVRDGDKFLGALFFSLINVMFNFLAFVGIHQMGLSLFRFIAAVGRTQVVSNTLGVFVLLITLVMGGFIISKDDIQPWMIWGYYTSPLMYGQNAIAINEFLDDRWSAPRINATTVGEVILKSRGFYTEEHWFWICIAALFGFSVLFNVWFIAALAYLSRKSLHSHFPYLSRATRRGMVLPFRPLSLAFNHVNYYVDMPSEMKTQGVTETRLQLLRDVSGAFRPGILTALVGVSGAGKTTLMDVLAGRKTGGYIEGSINISGYPKHQSTFARVSGYCEQTDIHSPNVTVHESLVYSAWLRLPRDINPRTRKMFVEEVMELVELNPIRDALVGLPGVDGLSTEQRKRLTIAVELVANPSIIFMDEPTSGLDARAAAIVMRAVRNTVDTGRTVVCTIHQPSIDIFEAFDELLLMKRGGQVIYAGPLGRCSRKLAVPGVPKINKEHNPATWMLEVTSPAMETQLEIDFTRIYEKSSLYQRNQELIEELSTPLPGSKDLYFPTKYSQSFATQYMACFWKQNWSYWRNPQYNAVRFGLTILIGILFGLIFWNKGQKIEKQQDLSNLLGGMYAAVFFLGATNTSTVQPIVAVERTVFYRERAAGMYSALPYAFGQVSNLTHSLTGYTVSTQFIYMAFVYFTLYGMMMVALTPNHQIAAVCMSFFLSFWNLFSGFLIPRPQIPIWWRWYYWCSPVAWTLYGVVTSQIGDKENLMEIPGLPSLAVNKVLEIGLGFEHSFLPVVVVAHLGFVCIFFFVFAFGIKFINFQTR